MYQLVNEDYRWWWRSFLHAGSCAFYTALYAVWYHLTELEMTGLVPVLLYYGYMSIICFTFFLVTGECLCLDPGVISTEICSGCAPITCFNAL